MSNKYNKTPAQISLNWLITQPNIVTLFKASNPAQITENIGATGWELQKEDLDRLTKEFPVGKTMWVQDRPANRVKLA